MSAFLHDQSDACYTTDRCSVRSRSGVFREPFTGVAISERLSLLVIWLPTYPAVRQTTLLDHDVPLPGAEMPFDL